MGYNVFTEWSLGLYFYLYLILDLYSRKIVGWEVQATESGDHAATLLRRTALGEAIQTWRAPLALHADNGSPMKSATLLVTLQWLGVTPSHSRPRVSNDNAYAEIVFRTCKYRPEYPSEGFATLDQARAWVMRFAAWYNTEHRHSGLNFVTPEQRHTAQAEDIMKQQSAPFREVTAGTGHCQSVWLYPEKSASPQAQVA